MALRTIIANYRDYQADIRQVRDEVFLVEQGIDPELELDERDACCQHALCYSGAQPIGTGRIDLEAGGKVGRVAVLPSARRQGVGSCVMHALESVARRNQLPSIWFHAQQSAVPFYEALGYRAVGSLFHEADIPHIKMEKRFANKD